MQRRNTIERLFRQYYRPMYALALSITGNDDDSKDIVSEVFYGLLRDKSLPMQGKEAAFLLTCVRNKCLNTLRHDKACGSSETIPMPDTADSEYDSRIDEILLFINSEIEERTRIMMTMYFLERTSAKEISEELGISETAVYKRLSQGIKKLKNRFNP